MHICLRPVTFYQLSNRQQRRDQMVFKSGSTGSPSQQSTVQSEMGIYRDIYPAIVIGDNFLPIIVIAQNNFDLWITNIAFVIHFVIADKLSQ